MNEDPKEPTLEDSIKEVMQTLPPVVRNYLVQGKYTVVAKSLATKYVLTPEHGSILEREIMLLLMGVENPDEFTQALVTEAHLNQETVSGIVRAINEQIFIPLREQMKSEGGEQNKSPSAETSQSNTEIPDKIHEPPLQSPRYFHLENKIPQPVRSTETSPQKAPTPSAPPTTPNVPAITSSVNILGTGPKAPWRPSVQVAPKTIKGAIPSSGVASLPPKAVLPSPNNLKKGLVPDRSDLRSALASITNNKVISDSKNLLEDHEEPHIDFHTTSQKPSPSSGVPVVPKIPPEKRDVLNGTPPPNLPGALRPSEAFGEGGMPPPEETRAPSAPQQIPASPKPYSVDPYREPIE